MCRQRREESFISQDSGVNGRNESGNPKTEIWPASVRAWATEGSKSLIFPWPLYSFLSVRTSFFKFFGQ